MILREGRLGGDGLVFPYAAVLQETVDLGGPVTRARAMLRGFQFGSSAGDRDLKALSVEVSVLYGDSPSQVIVRAETFFAGPATEWTATTVFVDYTLVAE